MQEAYQGEVQKQQKAGLVLQRGGMESEVRQQ